MTFSSGQSQDNEDIKKIDHKKSDVLEEKKTFKEQFNEIIYGLRHNLVSANDNFKVKWDIIIMFFALFNSFFVPI